MSHTIFKLADVIQSTLNQWVSVLKKKNSAKVTTAQKSFNNWISTVVDAT